MNYRVLGPLEVDAGAGPLPLRGKPQALMALFLLHANETLSADRIAEDLACERVDDVVSRLRGILPEDVIETHWGGYRLRVPDGALDLQRFEALAGEAGRAEPEQAARLLREALGLWRGPALAGLTEPFARGEAARLESSLRLSVEHHPQREQFMVSLYRAVDLKQLRATLAGVRLLTLTGPGGSGKTRLARELARAVASEYPGGVHFVSLEAVYDPDLVTTTILFALGLRQERHRLDVLVAELRDTRALLVLDHLDHVREAAMEMAVLLRRVQGPTLLVTCREALGVRDERQWPVARQPRTPLAAIHARLSERERRAFAHLSVFVGGAAPDAVADVSTLLERGLVRPDYTMEPSVREYAAEQLEARGETEAAAAAHAAYVCELAQAGGAGIRGPDEPVWSERLERELPNLRAAVAWLLARGRPTDVLDALIALTPFLWRFGHTREGRGGSPQRSRSRASTPSGAGAGRRWPRRCCGPRTRRAPRPNGWRSRRWRRRRNPTTRSPRPRAASSRWRRRPGGTTRTHSSWRRRWRRRSVAAATAGTRWSRASASPASWPRTGTRTPSAPRVT